MSSAEAGSEERPRREVAHRVFAAEFDDATLSYSESDEERAPNYVVTPTGARANRLFVAGVLTELDELGNGQLRARIVDPTGAFVVYAGQYQPEALATLERLSPPTFVAVTGKARTFEPEDSNRVFTSIRPETISEIDATTRDRWIVETAARTLDRVAEFAATLTENGAENDRETPIGDGDTGGRAQSGISLAREHYGTTPAYLTALSELALDAARLVAGDVEEVGALGVEPDETGNADLAALTNSPLGGTTVATIVDDGGEREARAPVEHEPESDAEPSGSGTDTVGSTDAATSTEPTRSDESSRGVETTALENDDSVASDTKAVGSSEGKEASETATTAVEDDETGDADRVEDIDDPTGGVDDGREAEGGDSSEDGDIEETEGEFDLSDEERAEVEAEYGTDFTTGTEVDDPGEADIEPTAPPVANDGADGSPEEDGTTTDITGTDESSESGSDVGDEEIETEADVHDETPAGTADPDNSAAVRADTGPESEVESQAVSKVEGTAPDLDVEPEQADTGSSDGTVDEQADASDAGTEKSDEPIAEESGVGEAEASDEDPGDVESVEDDDAADVDVTEAVMDAMRDLDDGNGADRDAVIERVSEEHAVPANDVEAAIQDALMGGQCYEPGDGTLKAI